MYVGVLGCVAGWSFIVGSPLLAIYTGILVIGFHLRVIFYEEPTLARQFGSEWTKYRATVNQWLPKTQSKTGSLWGCRKNKSLLTRARIAII